MPKLSMSLCQNKGHCDQLSYLSFQNLACGCCVIPTLSIRLSLLPPFPVSEKPAL